MCSLLWVQETRQLGDDEDKKYQVFINNNQYDKKPGIIYWTKN